MHFGNVTSKLPICIVVCIFLSMAVLQDRFRVDYRYVHPPPMSYEMLTQRGAETVNPQDGGSLPSASTLREASSEATSLQTEAVDTAASTSTPWARVKIDVGNRFKERKASVSARCQEVGAYPSSAKLTARRSLYYGEKYDILVCVTAKSGASTWKTHLLAMLGVNGKNPHQRSKDVLIHARTVLGEYKLLQKLKSPSTKVMTARHPLSRLVSAYRDKFRDGQMSPPKLWLQFAIAYNRNFTGQNRTVTFLQFLNSVLGEQNEKGMLYMNRHWRPYTSICSPCDITYDYFLKLETFSDDIRYVAEATGMTEVKADVRSNNKSNRTHLPSYLDYYEDVPDEVLRRILRVYKNDFAIFDYEVPEVIKARLKR